MTSGAVLHLSLSFAGGLALWMLNAWMIKRLVRRTTQSIGGFAASLRSILVRLPVMAAALYGLLIWMKFNPAGVFCGLFAGLIISVSGAVRKTKNAQ